MLFLSSLMLLAAFTPALALTSPIMAPEMAVMSTLAGSYNWSGYVMTAAAGSVTSASASWKVPVVTPSIATEQAAFWVGIDGLSTSAVSSTTVEQTGILAYTSSGETLWYAWFCFYPGPTYILVTSPSEAPVPISSGDTITASVTYGSGYWGPTFDSASNSFATSSVNISPSADSQFSGGSFSLLNGPSSGKFTITIEDTTYPDRWYFTYSQIFSGAERSTAEWIVETPALSVSPIEFYSLARFTPVTFTGCSATIWGKTSSLDMLSFSPNCYALTMWNYPAASKIMAYPSPVSYIPPSSFCVRWESAGP